MVLSSIDIYPVKSLRGFSPASAICGKRGLQFDRRWMIVDNTGVFLSQREYPRLAVVTTTIMDNRLRLTAQGMTPLELPLILQNGEEFHVQVWEDNVPALAGGNEAQEWISTFLGNRCSLVYMPDKSERRVDAEYALNGDIVSFADAFPLLIIAESSLEDLNGRLAKPLPMNRFRPNLVIGGCEAFAEDGWKRIRIGTVILRLTRRCARCITTTVDQSTGIAGKEPLATLSRYRKEAGKVLFGRNAIPENTGTLRIGEAIEIIE